MDKQLADLQITYADAKKLFGTSLGDLQKRKLLDQKETVDTREIPPRHFLCIRGIYVDFQRLEGVALPSETDEEEEFLEHPEGDPTKPCVEFPCKLWQVQEFLNQEGMSECIDPFGMADWVRKKLTNPVSEASSQEDDTADLHPRREATYQQIIASLIALQYGSVGTEPYKQADEIRDDCQTKGIKAPVGRTTLGDIIGNLPPVLKADPESKWTDPESN